MATDIVAGLRILRGIGGERTFGRNYAAQSQLARQAGSPPASGRPRSRPSACCSPASSSCCWSGSAPARSSPATSTIGQLISFLGYALFMIYPIQTFFELAQKLTRAMVSARKAIAIFEQQPPWPDRRRARRCRSDADLYDELSGFIAHDGELTIVVSRRARGHLGPRRPPGPLPAGRHRAGQPGARGGPQGPGRPSRPRAAARGAGPPAPPATRSSPTASGASGSAASTSARPRWTTYAGTSWSATPAASSSPARSRTRSTPTAG